MFYHYFLPKANLNLIIMAKTYPKDQIAEVTIKGYKSLSPLIDL